MAFRVKPTTKAKRDLDIILGWLFVQYAGESGLLVSGIKKEAVASLSELPQRCPLAPENGEFPFEMRQLLYGRKPRLPHSPSKVTRLLFSTSATNADGPSACTNRKQSNAAGKPMPS